MLHKRYKPLLPWSFALLLLFLTACGTTTPDFSNQEGVEVNIFAGLGSASSSVETSDLETQGVPSNPETGETGVDSAELEVFSGDTQLFFDDGRIVDEGEGDTVTLTPDDSEVSLFLPQGRYRFALTALDEQGNVLAQGETEQQVDEDSRVSIPLVSLIGSARFEVPESIKGNQVFDAFLRVSPPNRPDLEVALGDFTVTYDVQAPSVQLEGSSNIGVRIAAACDVVEVAATIDNDLSDTVTANATIPVNDPTCEGTGTDVGTDLVPPYVSINTPQADATLNKSFTLQGDVNDQQSGIDKVEVYEGTVKLGDATVDSDNRSWSFDASLDDGSYTLIAVAFDKAGNSSRAEVNVTVKEGSGNEVENCTSPVEIPDEVLESIVRDDLGKQEGDLTCADLKSITGIDGDGSLLEDLRSFEGLQYAVNLEFITLTIDDDNQEATSISDLSPLANLTKLRGINIETEDRSISDIGPLRNLINLERLQLRGNAITDISALSGLNKMTEIRLISNDISDLSPLSNLTNLETLELSSNNISDLSPLANLTSLQYLGLVDNRVSDLTPLQDLTALQTLTLGDNSSDNNLVSDLAPLQNLTNLVDLDLGGNQVSDLAPLENLTNLEDLGLSNNQISDISALVANEGLGPRNDEQSGRDDINLLNNPLDTCPASEARADIDALDARGVRVFFDEPENCEGGGDNGGGDDGNDNGGGDDNGDATITVNSTSGAASLEGECTLRAAITAANTDSAVGGCPAGNGADTVVLVEGATYTLSEVDNTVAATSGLPAVSSEITVEGNGATVERSTADTAPNFRPFHIAETGTLTLKDVTVQGGFVVDDGPVDGEFIAYSGGGIYNQGDLTLEQVTLQNNASLGGGGLSNAGTASVTESNIDNNRLSFDSPIDEGGGIRNTGELEVRGSTVNNNQAIDGAGIGNFGSLSVINSAVDDNEGANSGGLYNTGEVTLEQSSLSGLTCCTTGALFNSETGIITARDSRISGGDDGNTLVNRGEILFERVTYGGERELINSGTMTLVESTIRNNGDDIINSGTMALTNSTVSNPFGEVVGIVNDGTLTVTNSTLANNSTLENLGEAGALVLEGSIVTSAITNSDVNEPQPNCSGPITSQGYNLDSDGSCNFSQDTDLSSVDPLLGELQDNGGPTPTHALLEGSPAIDAIPTDVCSVETDQRGVERPQGSACDIGAFELEQ